MDPKTAIKISNLSKQYRLGLVGTGTLSHDLKRWYTMNLLGKEDPFLKVGEVNDRASKGESEYVWALKDIDLEIEQGDVVGIIGKNGAGKSTLLKILSRVTKPTTGTVEYRGRIASLLEVGTGFHPEMTGRENIYMNGSIMGMTRHEINRKLDEIISFAGVERYIDTPVKRYSSGMTVRLGFAVAAHLEPDILVVDEVLAVGDAEFQKKAIGKMQDVSKLGGRTVLFVSHDLNAVSNLTQKAVVLQKGKKAFFGNTDKGINMYLSGNQVNFIYYGEKSDITPKITKAEVKTSLPGNIHEFGKSLKVRFHIHIPIKVHNLALSFQVLDEFQNPITHFWIIDSETGTKRDEGVYIFDCSIVNPKIYMGSYSLRVYMSNSKIKERYDFLETVCPFQIEMAEYVRADYNWTKNACKYLEDFTWETMKMEISNV